MKRALTFALAGTFAIGMVSPIVAQDVDYGATPYAYESNGNDNEEVDNDEMDNEAALEPTGALPALLPTSKDGYITAESDNQLTIQHADTDEIIIAHIAESTVIIDANTGLPASLADRENDRVRLIYGPAVMMSYPAQASALVLAINLEADAESPHYHVIDSVAFADDDTLNVLVDNGSLVLRITRETPLFPHLTRQMVQLEHLQAGDIILAWYGVVARSYPGQATPDRVLFLSHAEQTDGTDNNQETPDVNAGILQALQPVSQDAYITDEADNQLTVQNAENDEVTIIHIVESTVIIDGNTGLPASLADRESDRVHIIYGPAIMLSYPAQVTALVVAVNLEENAMTPNYHIVDSVSFADDDTLNVLVSNGSLILRITRETPLFPYLTRQGIELEHLQAGDHILAWYGIVAQSFPAQATPDRVLFLRQGDQVQTDLNENDIETAEPVTPAADTVTPEPVVRPEPGQGRMVNGVEYFPVRRYAELAGYTVTWNQENFQAIFTRDDRTIILANNEDFFYVNGENVAVYDLSAAAFIEEGVMFAPYSFFAALHVAVNSADFLTSV